MAIFKFEQIARNITEKRMPTPEDKYTYIGLEHLDSGKLNVTRWGSEVDLIGQKLVMHKGDVLFGRRNTYLKRVAIAPHDGIFSAHGMIMRPNEEVVDKDFFPFFIQSDYFMDAAIRISVGSLSPTLNWKDLKELKFNLPSLDRQKEMAKVMMAFTESKESYENLLFQLDELVKARFVEMFGDGISTPLKYAPIILSDVFEKPQGGEWGADDTDNTGIPVLRTTNFTDNGKINYDDVVTRKIDKNKLIKKALKNGDTLIEKSGGSDTKPVGRVVYYDLEDDKYLNNNFTARLHIANRQQFNPLFVFYSVFVNYWMGGTKLYENQTTGIHNLHLQDYLDNTAISNPPVDIQNDFVIFAKQIDKSKFAVQSSLDSLNIAKKSFMDQELIND